MAAAHFSINERATTEQHEEHEPLEFQADQLDEFDRFFDELAVGDHAEVHAAVIGQHADARPDIASLRHPEQNLRNGCAGYLKLLFGSGEIGCDETGFRAE